MSDFGSMSKQKKHPSTAPGPMAGYLFQPVRALYWLAKGDGGTTVGIETEDDVTVLKEDGGKIREQDKSSIQAGVWPYGDKSHALWNTLCIWVRAIKAREVDVEKTEFFLVTNKKIPEGSLVEEMSEANDSDKITKCLERLKTVRRSIKKKSQVWGKVEEVLNSETILLRKLIEHISCDRCVSSIGEKEKQEIISALRLTDREKHDDIINSLLGWISRTVLSLWNNGKPGWIRRDSFDNQLEAIRNVHRRRRVRASPARKLEVSKRERRTQEGEIFVKQVEIIRVDDDVAYDAVTDFVRFGKEKLRVAQEGNVTEEDWEGFDENLMDQWKNVSGIEKTKEYRTQEIMGQAIYHQTMARKVSHVGELETESYLVRGGYHNLANDLLVGWHPNYKEKLAKFLRRGSEQ